jgi:hypothetical protein
MQQNQALSSPDPNKTSFASVASSNPPEIDFTITEFGGFAHYGRY